MVFLRQSTASQEIPLGPFLDSTDLSAETGLTIANTDILIWKNGATTLVAKNSGGATHISNGIYYAVLDATDTNTAGSLEVHVPIADTLCRPLVCTVLTAAVYDALIAGSGNLSVNLVADQSAATIGTCNLVEALSDAAADDVLDQLCEGAVTVREHLTCIASALFAETSGGGTTTRVFRNVGDTKDRITVTMDASGNRTAVTTDGT